MSYNSHMQSLSQQSQLQQQNLIQQYRTEAAAAAVVYQQGSSHFGEVEDTPRSLPEGATVLSYHPQSETHVSHADIQVIECIEGPRYPLSQKISLDRLKTTDSEITVQSIPTISNVYAGPVFSEEDPATGSCPDPFSGTGSCYAASYGTYEASRFPVPIGTTVGVTPLELGGCLSLHDHFAKGCKYREGAKFMLAEDVTGHGATGVLRDLSELENAPGDDPSSGFGVCCSWTRHIRVKASISIDPPQDPNQSTLGCFVVKKGTKWFGDYSIKDRSSCDGQYIANPTVRTGCGQTQGDPEIFNHDWVFDGSLYRIQDSVTITRADNEDLPMITFNPGSTTSYEIGVQGCVEIDTELCEDVQTLLDAFQDSKLSLYLRSGTGPGVEIVQNHCGEDVLVGTQTDRNLDLFAISTVLPIGTSTNTRFVIETGVRVPQNFLLEKGTTFIGPSNTNPYNNGTDCSDASIVATCQSRVILDKSILSPESIISSNCVLYKISCESKSISLPEGSYTITPLKIPDSSSWESFYLENSIISRGHVAQADITVQKTQLFPSCISLVTGSLLKARSLLAPGTVTAEGMRPLHEVRSDEGTVVKSPLSLLNSLTTSSPQDFVPGTIFGKSTALPVATVLTNGNHVPSLLTITTQQNVTLAPGAELINPTLFGNFTFNSGTEFEGCTEFPSGTFLSKYVALPPGTRLCIGSRFPFPLPFPRDTVFTKDHTMYPGTIFQAGIQLPKVSGRLNQDFTVERPNCEKPYFMVTMNGSSYLVVKSGTTLLNKFFVPKDSVPLATTKLHSVSFSGSVTAFTADAYDGGWVSGNGSLTISSSDWNSDNRCYVGTGATAIALTQGVPTAAGFYLLADLPLPFDFAIKISDSSSIFDNITFDVPFEIRVECKLTEDYLVPNELSVYNPKGRDIQMEITLINEFITPDSCTLQKKIILPRSIGNSCYISGILENPESFIRMPSSAQRPGRKFLVGPNGLEIAANSGSRASISLPHPNIVNVVGNGITLITPLILDSNWTILEPLYAVPPLTIMSITLPANAKLPSNVCFSKGKPLPAGLTSQNVIELEHDYEIREESSPYSVESKSSFHHGSIISKGSKFHETIVGRDLLYGRVECWYSCGQLSLAPGHPLDSTFSYKYFTDSEPLSLAQGNLDQELRDKVAKLELMIEALQRGQSQSLSHR